MPIFRKAKATQGPNLSRVGAKLGLQKDGAKWLYSWLRKPNHYHARTVMPNTFLMPITEADGKVSDPAADITAFLMKSTEGWKPTDVPLSEMSAAEHDALFDLALLYVKEKFPPERAKQNLKEGIPLAHAEGVQGG